MSASGADAKDAAVRWADGARSGGSRRSTQEDSSRAFKTALDRLQARAPELIALVLTPYLGTEEARAYGEASNVDRDKGARFSTSALKWA